MNDEEKLYEKNSLTQDEQQLNRFFFNYESLVYYRIKVRLFPQVQIQYIFKIYVLKSLPYSYTTMSIQKIKSCPG